MQQLQVATRKGLFVVGRERQGWRLGRPHFPGEPVTQVAADPVSGDWFAALRLGHFGVKVKRSRDRGASWEEVAAPAFPPKPTEGPLKDDATPWTVDLVWSLEAGADGRLWAGAMPAGLFTSDDGGVSWQLVASLWERPDRMEWFGGGYDHAGIHTIVLDPRDARHVTLAISSAGVWQTRDRGATWTNTSDGMEAGYMPPERRFDLNVQDVHRVQACAAQPDVLWAQHHCGMYRSTDGGRHWQELPRPLPSNFGFVVAAHPTDPQRAWFVPAHSDAQRMPADGCMVVNETRDGGATFTSHGEGLPARDAYHLVYRHALVCADDGQTLAMGSTTGGLWISEDEGRSWACVSRDLPPIATLRFV